MWNRAAVAAAILAGATWALPAAAQVPAGFYLGGGLGATRADFGCTGIALAGATCDKGDWGMKVFGGYQFNRYLAVEATAADLGYVIERTAAAQARETMTALDVSAIGSAPLTEGLALIGRLGAYRGKVKLSGPASGNRSTTNATYGIGIQYQFTRTIAARAEWQGYQKLTVRNDASGAEATATASVIGASVMWRF